jgi:hypothetical protein
MRVCQMRPAYLPTMSFFSPVRCYSNSFAHTFPFRSRFYRACFQGSLQFCICRKLYSFPGYPYGACPHALYQTSILKGLAMELSSQTSLYQCRLL